jgi:hypothetical protein
VAEVRKSVKLSDSFTFPLRARIKPKTKPSRIETLKEMVRAFGLNPEEILTKEALLMPNRTVITAGKETSEGQVDTLLQALKQRLKEDLLEKPIATYKTV